MFTVRKMISARIDPYLFFTPFEIIDIVFTLTFRKMLIKTKKEHEVYVKFNNMDIFDELKDIKFKFSAECTFGSYDLAEKRYAIEYTSNATSKTLMELGKNMYSCKFLDQRREIVAA